MQADQKRLAAAIVEGTELEHGGKNLNHQLVRARRLMRDVPRGVHSSNNRSGPPTLATYLDQLGLGERPIT